MEYQQSLKELFTKYLNKNISKDEYEILLKYFGTEDNQTELHGLVTRALEEDIKIHDNGEVDHIVDSVEFRLRQKLQPKMRFKLREYLPYAAVIIAALLGGAYLLLHNHTPNQNIEVITDVKPGRSAATLTLANGEKILLDNASNGAIDSKNGIDISKTAKGEIIYTIKGSHNGSETDLNTLSTANGETYQIVLSDGTKVWLNAASTLQYSVNLRARGTRNVKLLAGEAYFEVSKDKLHPFIVETNNQKVKVLGTHFNINSYADEGRTVTTLQEGSVEVSPLGKTGQKNNFILQPGQQSLFAKDHINIREADMESALAWKEGEIYFKDASIQEVLRQVSRWYNVEIKYESVPTKEVFNGGIKRTAKLSTVLHILELSSVHFKLVKENNITSLIVQ